MIKTKLSSRAGCLIGIAFFILISISSSWYYRNVDDRVPPETDAISWADAVEKCKRKYEAYRLEGQIKAPNCRKRTEDADYFYFSWSRPLGLFVEKSDGQIVSKAGKCNVSRKSGEIVYMTLEKTLLVDKAGKK